MNRVVVVVVIVVVVVVVAVVVVVVKVWMTLSVGSSTRQGLHTHTVQTHRTSSFYNNVNNFFVYYL